MPSGVHSVVLTLIGNRILRSLELGNRLSDFNGKIVCIKVADIGCMFAFKIFRGQLRPANVNCFDVRITGDLADFWSLATRAEDPDTLFFQRRLSLEGDTETGLGLKNVMDSIEFDLPKMVDDMFGRFVPGFRQKRF